MKHDHTLIKVGSALLISVAVLTISILAAAGESLTMDKKNLELTVGETDVLTVKTSGGAVSWSSENPSVVKVDGEGRLTGVAPGVARVFAEKGSAKDECTVYVVEKEFGFDDNILISVFWPPTQGHHNDRQWQYMKDAEIDWIMSSGDNLGAKDVQLKMLELSYKYGIRMTVADDRLGRNLLTSGKKSIQKVVEEYRNIPGANGYYMLDEPMNPNIFLDAYVAMKEIDPNAYMHLNFLPYASYGSAETYMKQMNDWCKVCAEAGYPLDYLMYDLYPYGLAANSMNRTGFLLNLDAVRKVGLRNNVRTANYIQSVTQSVAFRSPNRAETLYEINMSLAFGVKQLSYFTWFTPFQRSEPFEDGIISKDGEPNPKYEFICELDRMVHNVGRTLIRLDSREVYESKNTYDAIPLIPEEFFVRSTDKKDDFTVSYMRDKTDGRNYCMIVNNFFNKEQELSLAFDAKIKKLGSVSYEDGKLYDFALNQDGTADVTLEAGGAVLLVLPEDYDYEAGKEWIPAKGENLAKSAEIFAGSSVGSDGCYIDSLTDGDKKAGSWRSVPNSKKGTHEDYLLFDFGKSVSMNRADLYPCSTLFTEAAEGVAKNFKILASDDGNSFKQVYETPEGGLPSGQISVLFPETKARYLKFVFTFEESYVEIREAEIYLDDGSLPGPKAEAFFTEAPRGTFEVTYKEGKSLTRKRPVYVSSYPAGNEYKSWGWWPDFVVDGNASTGWTSNVKIHMNSPDSTEYCIVDMGDVFLVDQVTVRPSGCWPKDFCIKLSEDGVQWTDFVRETNSKRPDSVYTASSENPVAARFVCFLGTKLTNTAADGYMMQIAEIEAFGKPLVNYEEAVSLSREFLKSGGSSDSPEYTAYLAAIEEKASAMTQSSLDCLAEAMFRTVNTSLDLVLHPLPEETPMPTEKNTPQATEQTTPQTTDSGNTESKKGCGSVLEEGAAALSGALLAAAGITRKMKTKHKEK